ncbi:MAG TPA: fused MFS/spermidine synthase [Anaerohalosphaeraceae bacterium]|nr:fused MFS/spermidine synthase [Anaerohalosphaeraceae bacterium]
MSKPGFAKLLAPSLTVFTSNACIMIIELVASRLIARHLGSSLYTWTSVIGVVLAGITIGNYIGGRIADKFQARKTLACLFGLASVACVVIVVLNNVIGEWIWLWTFSWPVRVFLHISIVFLLPSILLGTISPVVATMALKSGLPTGATVGTIYAWGAAGSIAGTFLAGFYLIAAMGTVAIVWTISGAMLLIGLIYYAKMWVLYIWAIILAALMILGMAPADKAIEFGSSINIREKHDPAVIYEEETPYCHVKVRQISQEPDRREFLQDKLKHSEITMDNITELHYFYTDIFAGLTRIRSQDINHDLSFLIIGGGGYVFPQYLYKEYPNNQHIDVAEIDPGVTEAAYAAFGLPRDTRIRSISLDARNYVDELLEQKKQGKDYVRYDFIYEDAINDYTVPFQLVTQEFNEKIKQILTEDGLYLINLIDTYDNAQFLGAVVNTVKLTFPYVYVLTNKESFPELRETYVVASGLKPFDPVAMLNTYKPEMKIRFFSDTDIAYLNQKANGTILTDDYAPVENLLTPVVRQSAKELLAAKYLSIARNLKKENNLEKSIEYFHKAASNNSSMTILAYNEIGISNVSLNKYQDAVDAFKIAVNHYYNVEGNDDIIGSIHLNLGILYSEMKDNQNALEQFNLAIERFKEEHSENKNNHLVLNRMGNAYAMTGRFKEASDAFLNAHQLDPENHEYYGNLIKSRLSKTI